MNFDVDSLLSKWNILLVVAVWFSLQMIKRALPNELFDKGRLGAKLMPLAPIVVCIVAMWIPGPWIEDGLTAGQRLVMGVVFGAITSNFHTIASRLGLHQLLKLESDTRLLEDPPNT